MLSNLSISVKLSFLSFKKTIRREFNSKQTISTMKQKNFHLIIAYLLFLLIGIVSCSEDPKEVEKPIELEKKILALAFQDIEMAKPVEIDHVAHTVQAYISDTNDINRLIPLFELSPNTTVSPIDGVAYSFASPLKFKVTATDGTFTEYTVSVTAIEYVAPPTVNLNNFKLSTDQEAWAFALREGIITKVDENNYTIEVHIHHEDDIGNLTASFELATGNTITPNPTTIIDYSSPVTFSVSHPDAEPVKNYTVTVIQHDEKEVVWTTDPIFNSVDGIDLFTSTSSFRFNEDGTPMPFSAYAVKIDMTQGFNFVPYFNKTLGNMTVEEMVEDYYTENAILPLVGINAGYFGGNASYSLIIKAGELLSSNVSQLVRDGSFFVTRGAFGQDASGNFSADWVYTINPGEVYGYPSPSLNVDGETPMPEPTETYPANGFSYNKVNAIGGGPVLIREGQLIEDYQFELFFDDIRRSIANRTAIGVTQNNELLILVVDGRESYSAGIALKDMARILYEDLNCTHAMNLDGGGSSTLVLNGELHNQYSIDHGQRSVLTGLLIVKE